MTSYVPTQISSLCWLPRCTDTVVFRPRTVSSHPNNKTTSATAPDVPFYLRAGISTLRRSTSLAHHKTRNFGGFQRSICLKRVSGNAVSRTEVVSFHTAVRPRQFLNGTKCKRKQLSPSVSRLQISECVRIYISLSVKYLIGPEIFYKTFLT